MQLLSGTEKLNIPRTPGKVGTYEVWYLRFTDIDKKVALWYRQTLLARKGLEPEASLWMIFFDLQDPRKNFAKKITRPLSEARMEEDIFYFRVAGGEFYHKGTHGRLSGEATGGLSPAAGGAKGQACPADCKEARDPLLRDVSWELGWEPGERPLRHLPFRIFYHLPFPSTKIVSPNPDILVSGSLKIGERDLRFDRVPGQQSHLWGRRHADRWTWGHVNLFKGGEPALFEGLSAETRVAGRMLPPLTILNVRLGDERYEINRPWQWRRSGSYSRSGHWHFEGETGKNRVIGDVSVDPSHMIGVTYTDPDGSNRYCYHAEDACLTLQICKKEGDTWKIAHDLRSEPAMAYEFATREPLPDIPLKI